MTSKAKLVVCAALLVGWMAFIFFMSANNGEQSQGMSDGVVAQFVSACWPGYSGMSAADQATLQQSLSYPVRKLAHFTEYGVLGLLAFATICQAGVAKGRRHSGAPLRREALCAVAFSCLYACTDEFHQLFVGGRSAQLFDVGVDTAGAAFAVAVACAIVAVLRKRHRA